MTGHPVHVDDLIDLRCFDGFISFPHNEQIYRIEHTLLQLHSDDSKKMHIQELRGVPTSNKSSYLEAHESAAHKRDIIK